MPTLPNDFIALLENAPGADVAAFRTALESNPPVSIRLNPNKTTAPNSKNPVPWNSNGHYLEKRPIFTLDPHFQSGYYYVQEASSMFVEVALKEALSRMKRDVQVLDLCAAPGGKTTLAASMVKAHGGLVVSNEIISSRAKILVENVMRWGTGNVVVTNNRASDFSKLPAQFDVIIADAPCSGEGLFRKDEAAIQEWSAAHAKGCALRQKDILADIWPALKPGGFLIYSTCTYNTGENEQNMQWLGEEHEAEPVVLQIDSSWGILPTEPGYRFWPNRLHGEGFYLAMVQKKGEESPVYRKKIKHLPRPDKTIAEEVSGWLKGKKNLVQFKEWVIGVDESTHDEVMHLIQTLNVKYFGTTLAAIGRKGAAPEHPLAMSCDFNQGVFPRFEVNLESALEFLRGEALPSKGKPNGWHLVVWENTPLGFAKVVGNRINNYFPKGWRIRMDWKKHADVLENQQVLLKLSSDLGT